MKPTKLDSRDSGIISRRPEADGQYAKPDSRSAWYASQCTGSAPRHHGSGGPYSKPSPRHSREGIQCTEPGEPTLPPWLTVKASSVDALEKMQKSLRGFSLHSVCEAAQCPNAGECFTANTATFMILGDTCTRNCAFCNVACGKPSPPDTEEPENLAHMARQLDLKHVVVTSVTRDDLPDGGASQFVKVLEALRNEYRGDELTVELLIPDFKNSPGALEQIVVAAPEIINHNVETVPSLYRRICPASDYRFSLRLLAKVKEMNPSIVTKSGIMVGLGEKESEVIDLMRDLRAAGVEVLTIGQYLAPTENHYPIQEYIHPDTFDYYRRRGLELGFTYVASAPLVRSSYMAGKIYNHCR